MLTEKELEEIKRRMLELEEEPPVGGWQHIQAEVQPKKTWRPLWWLLPLLLLLLTGTGIYYMLKSDPEVAKVESSQKGSGGPVRPNSQPNTDEAEQQKPVAAGAYAASTPAREYTMQQRRPEQDLPSQQNIQRAPKAPVSSALVPAAEVKGGNPDRVVIALLPVRPSELTVPVEPTETDRIAKIRTRKLVVPVVFASDAKQARKAVTPVEHETSKAVAVSSEIPKVVAVDVEKDKAEQLPEAILDDKEATSPKKEKKPSPPERKVHSRNEWTAGVYFAPRYAFRKFIPNTSDGILITGVNNVNQLDPERMGYELGANYSRVLVPGLFLEGGVSWMQLKENVSYTLTTGKVDTFNVRQTGSGQIVVESRLNREERQLISSYAYGGIRLGATYYFLETDARRLNVTVAGGANLLIKGRTNQHINGEWKETIVFPSKENILEQSNYNLQLGVGYNASVLGDYEVTLMPTISYFLGSTFKEREPLGLKPYSLGLSMQLKRRFNR